MKAIGLMSGTSLDGIDAAVVDLERSRWGVAAKLISFVTIPYSGETLRLILEASDPATAAVDKVARLNFYLGELFSEAALKALKKCGLGPGEIEFISSHGQTIIHLPSPVKMGKHKVRATLQVGEPSVIAARTGITTVADFRPADVAAGGEGAPLVPYADYLMFRDPKKTRLLVNIGGIANCTLVPSGQSDPLKVQASDIGPGNMVVDELTRRMSNYKQSYDRDGRHAARGKVVTKILSELLGHPFFRETPPKSTGRERFGPAFVDSILEKFPPRTRGDYQNLVATATALTAESIFDYYKKFHARRNPVDEVIVSGGGAKNITLMMMLTDKFQPVPVAASDEYGIPALAKESIAFAVLGMETLKGRSANLPAATGAASRAVLGKVVRPS